MTSQIKVRLLRKSFGVIEAVNGISFDVGMGEVLGFLGPNGAGKTTTMKMITGFMPMSAGDVELCGIDIRNDVIKARQHLGYLPEGAPLYGEMTPLALLKFCAAIRKMPRTLGRRRMDDVIGALELEPVLMRRIDTLSKGFKRRVGLAQAVLHDPDVLILDEPTDGLDPNQRHHVRGLIRAMGKTKTIIISTHLLEEVDAVCSRALIIDKGQVVLEGTPEQLHAKAGATGSARVRVRDQQARQALEVLNILPQVSEVSVAERSDDSQLLRVSGTGTVPLAEISTALARQGIEMLELSTETGSLEDVFRSVTSGSTEPVRAS